jgi:hypothetical protein
LSEEDVHRGGRCGIALRLEENIGYAIAVYVYRKDADRILRGGNSIRIVKYLSIHLPSGKKRKCEGIDGKKAFQRSSPENHALQMDRGLEGMLSHNHF